MPRGRLIRAALMAGCLVVVPGTGASAQSQSLAGAPPGFDLEKTLEAARQVVRLFTDRIKGELSVAMKADGAANAVSLCQTVSPDISTGLSDESGFEVTRTSLKLRNPENAADAWELEVLGSFQEKAATVDPSRLEHFAIVVTPEGDKLFRYMKGIPVAEMCLACHGTDIKPDVRAELTRYYPDDKATGYKLGELRGAFSLVRLLGE
ncbi:MAG: DUF3365 domain-containing protein [Hyphomicrobiaceae bacterium]|nr:DUF3365 domain-containing protein [Hyphomicrobiaceae bacterium]